MFYSWVFVVAVVFCCCKNDILVMDKALGYAMSWGAVWEREIESGKKAALTVNYLLLFLWNVSNL